MVISDTDGIIKIKDHQRNFRDTGQKGTQTGIKGSQVGPSYQSLKDLFKACMTLIIWELLLEGSTKPKGTLVM